MSQGLTANFGIWFNGSFCHFAFTAGLHEQHLTEKNMLKTLLGVVKTGAFDNGTLKESCMPRLHF